MTRDDNPEVAALFALPPEEFVAARDQLAKRLRTEGDREGAKQVRELRRPTVPAWAVDQLVRQHPAELDELFAAGAALQRAQHGALSGQGAATLRDATAQRRDVIDRLTVAAASALTDSGRDPATHRAAIAATLEAASVDDEAAAAIRAGTLSHELTPPSSFGDLGDWSVFTTPAEDEQPAAEPEREPEPEPEPESDDEADTRRAELAEALSQAEARAAQADQAREEARREAAAAAQEVEGLEHLLAGARARAQAADQRRQEAETAADQTRQQAQQAQASLQELEKQ